MLSNSLFAVPLDALPFAAQAGLCLGLGFFSCCCDGDGSCGRAYAWGGIERPSGHLADNDEYDPDTWTNKTDLPAPTRYLGFGGHAGGKAYSCFGFENTDGVADTDEYDPDTWTAKTNGPAPIRWDGGSASFGNAIYCFYGSDNTFFPIRDTDEYAPDTWTAKTDGVINARHGNAGSATANNVYSSGGDQFGSELRDHEQFAVAINTWSSMTDMPTPGRFFAQAVALGLDVCVLPGEKWSGSLYIRDTDSWNETSGSWTSRTDCPLPARSRGAAQGVDGAAYFYCGLTSGTTDLKDTEEFVVDVWTSKTDCPTPARDELYGACL